jgi:hypothetical protein
MVANAMLLDNVPVWIAVGLTSKKRCIHVHWIRHKMQRRHVLEAPTIERVIFVCEPWNESATKKVMKEARFCAAHRFCVFDWINQTWFVTTLGASLCWLNALMCLTFFALHPTLVIPKHDVNSCRPCQLPDNILPAGFISRFFLFPPNCHSLSFHPFHKFVSIAHPSPNQ